MLSPTRGWPVVFVPRLPDFEAALDASLERCARRKKRQAAAASLTCVPRVIKT